MLFRPLNSSRCRASRQSLHSGWSAEWNLLPSRPRRFVMQTTLSGSQQFLWLFALFGVKFLERSVGNFLPQQMSGPACCNVLID